MVSSELAEAQSYVLTLRGVAGKLERGQNSILVNVALESHGSRSLRYCGNKAQAATLVSRGVPRASVLGANRCGIRGMGTRRLHYRLARSRSEATPTSVCPRACSIGLKYSAATESFTVRTWPARGLLSSQTKYSKHAAASFPIYPLDHSIGTARVSGHFFPYIYCYRLFFCRDVLKTLEAWFEGTSCRNGLIARMAS